MEIQMNWNTDIGHEGDHQCGTNLLSTIKLLGCDSQEKCIIYSISSVCV